MTTIIKNSNIEQIKAKMDRLIQQEKAKHINDPSIYLIWEEMTRVLSENITLSIQYMKQVSMEELAQISQVFDDIMLQTQSIEFFRYLSELRTQQVNSDMLPDIDIAINCYSNTN